MLCSRGLSASVGDQGNFFFIFAFYGQRQSSTVRSVACKLMSLIIMYIFRRVPVRANHQFLGRLGD